MRRISWRLVNIRYGLFPNDGGGGGGICSIIIYERILFYGLYLILDDGGQGGLEAKEDRKSLKDSQRSMHKRDFLNVLNKNVEVYD